MQSDNTELDNELAQILVEGYNKEQQSCYLGSRNLDNRKLKLILLSDAVLWGKLKAIYLSDNRLGYRAVGLFARVDWNQLEALDLCYNNLGDQGVRYLAKARMPRLQTLQLSSNNVGIEGVQYLGWGAWPQLAYIYLTNNGLPSTITINILKAQNPAIDSINSVYIYPD